MPIKNVSSQIRKNYPNMSELDIRGLVYNSKKMVHELRELHKFFVFYGVLIDEMPNKCTEIFSSKMVLIILSLKKRLDRLNRFYKNDLLTFVIALQNELEEAQLQKHWAAFFLLFEEMQRSIVSTFDKRLRYINQSYIGEDISNQSINDELLQLIKPLYSQISKLKLKTKELIELVSDSNSKPSEKQPSISSLMLANEEHPFFLLPEEVKVSILAYLDVEDLITVQIASRDLSETAATAFAVRFKKKPAQVIAHLSQIAAEEAYNFVEGYRRTSEYKALKSLVEYKMPMSDQEVICYMLTRHHTQLPDIEQLKNIHNAPHIDSKARAHLNILMKNVLEFDQADQTYKDPKKVKVLFDIFQSNFNKSYLNLLPSIEYYIADLVGKDLSYAPLSHAYMRNMNMSEKRLFRTNLSYADLIAACLDKAVLIQANLSYANLRYSTFRQANLKQVNLRGADLIGAEFEETLIDGTDFTGTNLAYAQLINVDMRAVDLSQVNVEWAYLKNLRIVPDAALDHVESLENYFNSFEKNFVTHTSGSRMKWRFQMLEDLNRLIIGSYNPETHILFLKKVLAHYPIETFTNTIFIKEHPFKHQFEQFELIPIEKIELPLQEEVISILDELQNRIDNPSMNDNTIPTGDLEDRFAQCFAKVPELTNVNQICQLSNHHFFLFQLLSSKNRHNSRFKPYLVNYPRTVTNSMQYASQIFDGELFHLEQLQRIQPEEIDSYLYSDKDFISKQSERKLVKLGGLFISYTQWGGGVCLIQLIDFENRRLKFGFAINMEGNSWSEPKFTFPISVNSELYLPIKVLTERQCSSSNYLFLTEIPRIRAGFELRASLTHYIFATQKGPVPKLTPITRITPLSENENTEACINTLNDKDETPLLGQNRYGFHRKAKDPCLCIAEKMVCQLT